MCTEEPFYDLCGVEPARRTLDAFSFVLSPKSGLWPLPSEQGTPRAITTLDAPPRVRGDDDGDGRGFESPRVFFREVICARATPATFLIDGFCYILE